MKIKNFILYKLLRKKAKLCSSSLILSKHYTKIMNNNKELERKKDEIRCLEDKMSKYQFSFKNSTELLINNEKIYRK